MERVKEMKGSNDNDFSKLAMLPADDAIEALSKDFPSSGPRISLPSSDFKRISMATKLVTEID